MVASLGFPAATHSAEGSSRKKVLYDVNADGAKQIEAALAKAQKENKNVILTPLPQCSSIKGNHLLWLWLLSEPSNRTFPAFG